MNDILGQLPKIQDADLKDKVVLVRVDHNVVKDGLIKDPFRIDITLGTLFNILAKGGKLILMTHVGRPHNKKTGEIDISDTTSVDPIVRYLRKKIYTDFWTPEFDRYDKRGYVGIDTSINLKIRKLRSGAINGIYLPNTRWFNGEEGSLEEQKYLSQQLAGLADVYVNDAFGSWQPHASTVGVTNYLPSYAGFLLQNEIESLNKIFDPINPMLAIIAGSKFDTKIGPLRALLEKVDYLILGGVIYNAYLAVKYDLEIEGISADDIEAAREFLDFSEKYQDKIIEPTFVIESDTLEGKMPGKHRIVNIKTLPRKTKLNYILDVAPQSFDEPAIQEVISKSASIFVNAVMGLTPHFYEGTIKLFQSIDENKSALKMLGGGDTLQEFRVLLPGKYLRAVDDPKYYFFSGGGTILTAIEHGSVDGLEPIRALIDNKGKF
ncbi:MAG: phosphoglycerate kinase [Candidatus Cloacimonas sp.]|nr:phosphoglycerate kinase [Candidatus Cloacimonadota bacterium]